MYGKINDYSGKTHENGKQLQFYSAWSRMFERAYGEKTHVTHATYVDVTVCDEWFYLTKFKEWHDEFYIVGMQLDKDILSDKKIYSPSTCCFVPASVNSFVVGSDTAHGKYPLGVSFDGRVGRGFRANCSDPFSKKNRHLGYFSDEISALLAWKSFKLKMAKKFLDAELISVEQYSGIKRIISNA